MSKWDELSMAEKAEMIGVAVKNGITNLPDIRQKYNEFAEGGNTKKNLYPIGGLIPAINVPSATKGAVKEIRQRLYDNITPFGYHSPVSRTVNAVVKNQKDDTRTDENKRIKDSVPEASALDAIWATYLNIPEDQRRKIDSRYNISKTKDGYYRFNNPGMIFNFEQDLSPQGLYSLSGRKAVMMNGILGNYTKGLGRDTKGDYIFYSDSRLNPDGTPNIKTGWDINPYSNTVDNDTEETTEEHGQYGQDKKDLSYKIGKVLFGNIEDMSMGIGTPVPIYDRIYLDNYYGVPRDPSTHYLPEVIVTGKKHSIGGPLVEAAMNEYKKGGGIHIKPSHRGKFTALKERTGHSASWFKEHGTPAQKKMAIFALNSRKWKYELGGPLVESIAGKNIYGLGDWIEKARGFIKKIGLDRSPGQHLIEYFTEGDESEKSGRQKVYKAIDGSVHSTKEAAIQRNNNLAEEGRAYIQRGNNIKGIRSKVVPRKPNTSSTAEKSMQLENNMFSGIDRYRERTNYRTKPYDIPYGTKEIKVQPKGNTLPFNISVNALDSVAKYAGATGTPIEVALGLPMQETAFGRNPLFNYGKLGENYSSQDLGNANYFKNFGSIPAEYLVRNFRYNGDIVFNGKRDEPISLDTPPLQHAFEYFNAGKYNTNDKNHTKDVKAAGNALWNETTGSLLDWWDTEGKSWYNKGTKQKKKK